MKSAPTALLIALSVACASSGSDRGAVAADSARPAIVPTAESLALAPAPSSIPRDSAPVLVAIETPVAADSLSLMIPVEGVMPWELRDTFGDPRTGHAHEALDIMAPRGTRVLSATAGRLTKLHLGKQGGIMVYAADASDRYVLMYGHLDRYADGLTEGMPLVPGQLIGFVGSSGDASAAGPHLHFAIARGKPSVQWWKGEPVNPYPLLFRPK